MNGRKSVQKVGNLKETSEVNIPMVAEKENHSLVGWKFYYGIWL